jgi:predicted GNAT family acetyltransferase
LRSADGHSAVANYRLADGMMTFTHTEVAPEVEGRDIGSRQVHGALEDARKLGYKMVPRCPFVGYYLTAQPEFADLLL